jgi:hypothetical protein
MSSNSNFFYPNCQIYPFDYYKHLLEMKLGHLDNVSNRV